ncbi:hypothetical protein BDV97DRAFT_347522 [Delphinella strobiligena]|nr:hypothetical protein BDV97DRAFT_347522 [Delphinella strobiligena]
MTSPCMDINYGDMKSWPLRLLLDADGGSGDPRVADKKKKAIEIWSLLQLQPSQGHFPRSGPT